MASPKKYVRDRELAWRNLLLTEDGAELNIHGKTVVKDLMVFCNAIKSTYNDNPQAMARNVGRQEVIQRIFTYLKLDYHKFYELEEEENFYD